MICKEQKDKAIAIFAVAMFMLSACVIALTPQDAQEYDSDSYTINMRVGDSFNYEPQTNIVGTEYEWSGDIATTGMTVVDGEQTEVDTTTASLSFVPTAKASNIQVVLTATEPVTKQEITQNITFNVLEKLSFTASDASDNGITITRGGETATGSVSIPTTAVVNDTYFNVIAHGGSSPIFQEQTVEYSATINGTYAESDVFTVTPVTDAENKIALASVPVKGYYKVTMPCAWSVSGEKSNNASESVNVILTIAVVDGVAIDPNQTAYVVAGSSNTAEITLSNDSNVDSIDFETAWPDTQKSITDKVSASMSGVAASGKATLSLDATALQNSALNLTGKNTITLNVRATGVESIGGTESGFDIDQTVAVTVYKHLYFTTKPVVDYTNSNIVVSSNNGLDILLTTSVQGATKLTYSWGDGSSYTRTVTEAEANYYTANHTYGKSGTYFIQVTASNDFYDTTYITPYTTTGSSIPAAKTLKVEGIEATYNDDKTELTLKPVTVATVGYQIGYEWKYSTSDVKDRVIKADQTKPDFVKGVYNDTLVLNTAKLTDDMVFTVSAFTTFNGDSEETRDSASYSYNKTSQSTDWMPLTLMIAGIVICLVLAIFVYRFGGLTFASIPAILAIVLLVALLKMMGVF